MSKRPLTELCALLSSRILIAKSCMTWNLKRNLTGWGRRIFLLTTAPLSLINAYLKNLISARSISMDRTFKTPDFNCVYLRTYLSTVQRNYSGPYRGICDKLLNYFFACSIWEYSLLNPNSSKSGKRKPQSTDPVHPNKSDFIRAKHQLLSYVFKPAKDDVLITESDLSKQLHSR
jgi:hypothetical protein